MRKEPVKRKKRKYPKKNRLEKNPKYDICEKNSYKPIKKYGKKLLDHEF